MISNFYIGLVTLTAWLWLSAAASAAVYLDRLVDTHVSAWSILDEWPGGRSRIGHWDEDPPIQSIFRLDPLSRETWNFTYRNPTFRLDRLTSNVEARVWPLGWLMWQAAEERAPIFHVFGPLGCSRLAPLCPQEPTLPRAGLGQDSGREDNPPPFDTVRSPAGGEAPTPWKDNLRPLPETPVPAVPEPSTWAMMILGFSGLGVLAYRRRNLSSSVRGG